MKISSLLFKTLFSASLLVPLLPQPMPAVAAAATVSQPISLMLDGKPLDLKQSPVLINGAVYVPLREVLEACGAQVEWKEQGHLYITYQGQREGFRPSDRLDHLGVQASLLQNDRWLIHVRLLHYFLGADINWDAATRSVQVSLQSSKLFQAINSHRVEDVQEVLAQGIDPNSFRYKQFMKQSALDYAMDSGNADVVKTLYHAGSQSAQFHTPLDKALEKGPHMVRALLEAGYNPNNRETTNHLDPIIHRVHNGYTEVLTPLLFDATPEQKLNQDLLQHLLLAALQTSNGELVALLLQAGANPNLTPINEIAIPPLLQAASRNNPDIIKSLIHAGADPNVTDKHGFTPLMIATEYGNTQSVQAILESKADPNLKNAKGVSAWMIANMLGNTKSADLLLASGAEKSEKVLTDLSEYSSRFQYGPEQRELVNTSPPLEAAVLLGQSNKVKQLLTQGENPNVLFAEWSLLELAAFIGYPETVETLLTHTKSFTQEQKKNALQIAIQRGDTQTIELLLKNGVDPTPTQRFLPPLQSAATHNQNRVLEVLLASWKDEWMAGKSDSLIDPIRTAVSRGNTAALKSLLSVGFDMQSPDVEQAMTVAMTTAIEKGTYACLKLLLEAGPSTSAKEEALRFATTLGNREAIEILQPTTP